MSKRINVIVSDTLNEKLDSYSERYGVSKSSICALVVGQWVDQLENAKTEQKSEILSHISRKPKEK